MYLHHQNRSLSIPTLWSREVGRKYTCWRARWKKKLHYYEKRKDAIVVTLEYLQTQEQAFDRGAHALLHTLLEDTRQQLDKCRLLFSASSKELSLPCVSDEDSMSSADSEEDMDDI